MNALKYDITELLKNPMPLTPRHHGVFATDLNSLPEIIAPVPQSPFSHIRFKPLPKISAIKVTNPNFDFVTKYLK